MLSVPACLSNVILEEDFLRVGKPRSSYAKNNPSTAAAAAAAMTMSSAERCAAGSGAGLIL